MPSGFQGKRNDPQPTVSRRREVFMYGTLASLLFAALLVGAAFVPPTAAADGTLDATFNFLGWRVTSMGVNDLAQDVAVLPDGKIVALGSINDGTQQIALLRVHANGLTDNSFGNAGKVITTFPGSVSVTGYSLAVQPDGKIIVAGRAGTSSDYNFAIARFMSDGSPDVSFGSFGFVLHSFGTGSELAYSVTVQPDGKIVVAGEYGSTVAVARFTSGGFPDPDFAGDGDTTTSFFGTPKARGSAVQPDGKIVVAGWLEPSGGGCSAMAVRYNPNGSLDTTFDGDGKATVPLGEVCEIEGVAVQPDGKIVLGGTSAGPADTDLTVLRLNGDGTRDNGFDGDGIALVNVGSGANRGFAVAVQMNGRIVIAGESVGGTGTDIALARLMPSGAPDASFGNGGSATTNLLGNESARGMRLQPDGKIVIAANCNDSGNDWLAMARYTNSGGTGLFDFDGDGRSDISIFRPSNGQWWLNRSAAGVIAHTFGNSSDKIAPADFTGDGKTDVAIYRAGSWFILRSEDYSFYSFPFGNSTDVPTPADYDGDGKADAAVFRPSNATWYIQKSSGGTLFQGFGASGDIPVAADYDGDGMADIAIYRPNLGQWWLMRTTGGVIAFTFGNSTDKPVPGDFTGDGRADVAIWRSSNGNWYVLRSEDYSFYSFPFGTSGDIPAPADYDGDGRVDAAVFRIGTWYVSQSTQGLLIQQFGAAGDRPAPAAYIP